MAGLSLERVRTRKLSEPEVEGGTVLKECSEIEMEVQEGTEIREVSNELPVHSRIADGNCVRHKDEDVLVLSQIL